MGVAVFGAILTNQVSSYLIGHTPPGATRGALLNALANDNTSHVPTGSGARELFINAYAHAIHAVFLWAVPIAILGFLLSWLLPEIRLSTRTGLRRGRMEDEELAVSSTVSQIE
jgi:hypothetical protein